MRRLVLPVVLFCLASLPAWADYGMSNVVEQRIDRGQSSGQSVPPPSGEMTRPAMPVPPEPARPAPAKPAEQPQPPRTQGEAAPPYSKSVFYPYTIHISSWQSKKDALAHHQKKSRELDPVFITKIDLGARGIWYRVDYGIFTGQKDASERMGELKAQGVIETESFVGSAVPYAIELGVYRDKAGAAGESLRLREKGIVSYVVKESDTAFRLLMGAYPGQKSAGPALEDLAAMGLKAKIAKR